VSDPLPLGKRLDSWKAIAEYLQRDVATVARWEKLGMPVRRVAGSGRSVFAYSADLDRWLQTARPVLAVIEPTLSTATPTAPIRRFRWSWAALTAAALVLAVGLFARPRPIAVDDLRIEITDTGVTALDSAGVERWRHLFPANYKTGLFTHSGRVIAGARPGVYFGTAWRTRHPPGGYPVESGVLTLLDLKGNPQRSFSFDDQVRFQGTTFGPPWILTAFAIHDAEDARRVAVTAHHSVWDPGLLTILDNQWQRRGTFVHAGWIEGVRWLGRERLLINGFSNARDGGMIALLDSAALDGQGPEPAGSRHFCETCGTDRPLRMFVFPRSELNRVTASRFNRAVVEPLIEKLIARTIEVGSDDGDVDALYEFTPSFDLVRASFSERYWDMHRALELKGTITHTRELCPDRDGPRQIQVWDRATGWRTVQMNDGSAR
jgi:hypothetical protein